MRFVLDGDDRLSRVLNRAGDSAHRLHRRLDASFTNSSIAARRFATRADSALTRVQRSLGGTSRATNQLSNQINRMPAQLPFTRDAQGRLRNLRGQFLTTAQAAAAMRGDFTSLPGPLRAVGGAAGDAAEQVGGKSGGLGGAMMGVAAIAGLSLLPALGALAPMMVGAGVAAGTLKLGFAGVGEAAALASTDKKKYKEALKKLSPEARGFTQALVGLKTQFSGLGKDIQKAMLPGFTQAVKDAAPFVKLLGRGMTEMGKGFGEAASGAGKLLKDSGFQKDFAANMKLGAIFVKDLTSGLGSLARGFLDFGAASEPTLRSLSSGIAGLLGKGGGGLVGMFEGLKTGVQGSAQFLDGLFYAINDKILPALGRLSGEAARTFGPFFGELLRLSGKTSAALMDGLGAVFKMLMPVFKEARFGVKALSDTLSIMAPTARELASAIGGALLPSFSQMDQAVGPLQRLSRSVQENKQGIQEFSRIGAVAILDFVSFGIEHLPHLVQGFRYLATGALTALDAIISGAAHTFGWIPGIGDKLKGANREFDKFKNTFITGLHTAEGETRKFAASVAPKLAQNKLKMNIANWQSQIATAKAQMKSVPPEKQAKLKANIADLQAKIRKARGELNALNGKTAHTYVITHLQARKEGSHGTQLGYAQGGLVGYPGGGPVRGPGTGTSDSILARVSNGEFVMRAKSVAQYGLAFMQSLNEGKLGAGASAARSAVARPTAAAPTTVVIHAPITITGVTDPLAAAREAQRQLLKLKRAYGANVQLGVG
ncbi:hypothetical protein [Streptomyces sp. SYSU K21746]